MVEGIHRREQSDFRQKGAQRLRPQAFAAYIGFRSSSADAFLSSERKEEERQGLHFLLQCNRSFESCNLHVLLLVRTKRALLVFRQTSWNVLIRSFCC